MTYEFHPDALVELQQTAHYYDACEAGLGIRFIDRVEETLANSTSQRRFEIRFSHGCRPHPADNNVFVANRVD